MKIKNNNRSDDYVMHNCFCVCVWVGCVKFMIIPFHHQSQRNMKLKTEQKGRSYSVREVSFVYIFCSILFLLLNCDDFLYYCQNN